MSTSIRRLFLAVAASLIATSVSSARAQSYTIDTTGGLPSVSLPGTELFASSPVVSYSSTYIPPAQIPVRTYYYSYYMTSPIAARTYVPYGATDSFEFYGRPYGHPYDRWTWSAMSGDSGLARYYYPPVR